MGFFKKLGSSTFKGLKKDGESWAVILKGAPDKKVEEALFRIFTERLAVPGDDTLKIVRSSPIILFSDRTAREAEQIKLILNRTGARTAISNDPADLRTLPHVAWPKKIEVRDLAGGEETPSAKPVVPAVPKIPTPPPTPYENLQQAHQELQTKLKISTEERDRAVREREETKTRLGNLEPELLTLKKLKSTLEKELVRSQEIRESLIPEIEKIRASLENLLESLKGSPKPNKPGASIPSPKPAQTPLTPITPTKRSNTGGSGSGRLGIIPPAST